MPWQTMTTPTAGAGNEYTAADMDKIVDNISWLKAARPMIEHDSSTTSWSISSGAWVFEDDGDTANFKLDVTITETSTITVIAFMRWTSDTVRDQAFKARIKNHTDTAYGNDNGYAGTSNADRYEFYVAYGQFSGKTAGTYEFRLQGARNNGFDTVTIDDRQMCAIITTD